MKSYLIIRAIFIITTVFISSCYMASDIYKLSTFDEQTEYLMGREIISKEIDSIVVSVNFEEQLDNDFTFLISIENNSEHPIFVEPNRIFVETFDNNLIRLQPQWDTMYAIDPEMKIVEISQQCKNRESEYKTSTNINAVFGLLSIISDAALSSREKVVENLINDIDYFATKQIIENENYNARKAELLDTKNFWQNEVIRKTDLYPSERISGKCFIPLVNEAGFLKLHILIEDKDFIYTFKQIRLTARS
ncbi:MAG: hypothetical protein HXY50_11750 [Ignavibacteriaceae bacterium]|nr:hypothetical protein [Ignavibacteriaceae bacterium]